MKHLKYFKESTEEIPERSERRERRAPIQKPIDISEFSKDNKCKANCQREVIRTKEGPRIVCLNCKRIVR